MKAIFQVITFFGPLLAGTAIFAEEEPADPKEGHSYHGHIFNTGPRQAAVLIPGTGDVHLKISTKSEEAQKFFDQGLGQLHGYWDFEAERSFRQAAMLDPECAMAYWGMAHANFKNNTRGKGFADEAAKRREHAGEQEKMWIDGLTAYFKDVKADQKKRRRDYLRSIEKIVAKYPDELEAKAFLMRFLYDNHKNGGLPIASHYTADLLAKQVLEKNPHHPVHHYRIHLWDREGPSKAIDSAAACGPAAPGIAHMWHMPGHIYSYTKRYADGAWQQEASARVDHAHMIRYWLIPDQISNFDHNNEWCIRNLNYIGRVADAIDLSKNMIELPRLAKFRDVKDDSTYRSDGSSWKYGRQRLRDTLFQYEMWGKLLNLAGTHYLEPDNDSLKQTDHDKFIGIAKFESGDSAGAQAHLSSLEKQLGEEQEKQDKAVANAAEKARSAKKSDKDIENAKKSAERNFSKKIGELEAAVNELSVYAALNSTPPDAKKALQLLPKLGRIDKARRASLYQRAGNNDEAVKLAGEAVSSATNQVLPLARQVEILHQAGKSEDAKTAFESLRKVAAHADANIPIFQRLSSLAEGWGYPKSDWKEAPVMAADLGERPDLDSLGPFRWSPPAAPDFTLPDSKGSVVKLSDRLKKPTLVIFFLGKGCVHCMEQLNKFAPVQEKYAAAGINILAVSTDSVEGLRETLGTADEPFPFEMLSDPELAIFKKYRAYDDFEAMPLHGTFLIDTEGSIRWQDIGFEPFNHPDWLLEESVRLLSFGDS
ncbi:MAG: redoxin domain-containing protein [Verrucomicrobiales bacterium]|nr:redoxin domain-containing protein [Verrucomicrobiales bacterium]